MKSLKITTVHHTNTLLFNTYRHLLGRTAFGNLDARSQLGGCMRGFLRRSFGNRSARLRRLQCRLGMAQCRTQCVSRLRVLGGATLAHLVQRLGGQTK